MDSLSDVAALVWCHFFVLDKNMQSLSHVRSFFKY